MSQPNDGFTPFLKSNTTAKGEEHTHTKIPDKKLNIYPGSYSIDPSEEKSFYSKYYKHVFVKKTLEYLTEKQLREDGPIMIDIDLRYSPDTTEKQHTVDHVIDVVMLYAEKIKQMVTIPDGADIDVFVM